MATTAVTTRTVWIPVAAHPNHQRVVSELVDKLRTLAFAPPKVYLTQGHSLSGTYNQEFYEITFQLTSANDTTLIANFPAWASLLGIPLIDTNAVSTTAGH